VLYNFHRSHLLSATDGVIDDVELFYRWGQCDPMIHVEFESGGLIVQNGVPVASGFLSKPLLGELTQFEYRDVSDSTWRELCYGVGTNPFARSISGQEAAAQSRFTVALGDCQTCSGSNTAVTGVRVVQGVSSSAPFGTDSPFICFSECANATGCAAFGYADRTCTLYDEPPKLGVQTGQAMSVHPLIALSSSADLVVFCMDGINVELPPPQASPELAPACGANALGVVPNCQKSECDGTVERAIALNPREAGCNDECARLCIRPGLELHRSLQSMVPLPRVRGWGTLLNNPSVNDYRAYTRLRLEDRPFFEFQVVSVPYNETLLASIRLKLPMLMSECEAAPNAHDLENFSGFAATLYDSGGNMLGTLTQDGLNDAQLHSFERFELTFEPENVQLDQSVVLRLALEPLAGETSNATFMMPGAPRTFCDASRAENMEKLRLLNYYLQQHDQGSDNATAAALETLWRSLNSTDDVLQHHTGSATVAPTVFEPLHSTLSIEALDYCRTNNADFHICWPHTPCADHQFRVRPGTLHADTVCREKRLCRWNEYEKTPPTATSDRLCVPHTVCGGRPGGMYKTNQTGTSVADATCALVSECDHSNNETYFEDGGCTQIVECQPNEREVRPLGLQNRVCAEYEVECTALEVTTAERTATDEKQCTAATICKSDEFVASGATEQVDRVCKPILSCKTYEIETGMGGITQQTVCTSILQWSSVWIYAAIGTAGVILSAIRGWPI
jgi:hypothetical protein